MTTKNVLPLALLVIAVIGFMMFSGLLPKSIVLPVTTIQVGGSASTIDTSGNVIVSGFTVNNGWTFGGCSPEPCYDYGITGTLNIGEPNKDYKLNSLTCTFIQGSGGVQLSGLRNWSGATLTFNVGDNIGKTANGSNTYQLILTGNRTTFDKCTLNLTDLTPPVIIIPQEPTTPSTPISFVDVLIGGITGTTPTTTTPTISTPPPSFWQQNLWLILGVLVIVGIIALTLKRR